MNNDCLDSLRDFLCISYDKLKEYNLEMKKDNLAGKSDKYFFEKISKYLKEEKRIKALTVGFTDLEGRLHMLDYDKEYLLESYDNLTFDGSSISGFAEQEESDLRLVIDWSSFRWLPADIFGPGKVMVFCNVKDRDGSPYKSCFRTQLKIIRDKLFADEKLIVNVAPEVEGFLLKGVDAEQDFTEKDGLEIVTKGGYYSSLPLDPLRQFIDKAAEAQRAMGFENEKDHPEVAPSQFELSYKYTEVVGAADQIQLYKLTCRQIAKSMGYTASFLPKPRMNINGSGMHTNISISKNNNNIFYDKSSEFGMSKTAHEFINSILYHAKSLCLILNPSVNSYRRLDPNFEAPNEIKVSSIDRSSMIRIPLGNEKSARIEVRSVGPDVNPYLELFSLVVVGFKGIKAKNSEKDLYKKSREKREKLPSNIYDAIRYFKTSKTMQEVLGEDNQRKYVALKERVAQRSPKELGKLVKLREIVDHHEVTNQKLWNKF